MSRQDFTLFDVAAKPQRAYVILTPLKVDIVNTGLKHSYGERKEYFLGDGRSLNVIDQDETIFELYDTKQRFTKTLPGAL